MDGFIVVPVGPAVGDTEGRVEKIIDGSLVGRPLGLDDCDSDGFTLGKVVVEEVGKDEGASVGNNDGELEDS